MSLYDALESGSSEKKEKKEETPKPWTSSGLKLLQSQIAQKKASLTTRDKQRSSLGGGGGGGGGGGVAAVVDLRASSGSSIAPSGAPKPTLLGVRKPASAFTDGPPLSFIPTAAKDEQVLIFGEIVVENEYDPMVPNDFNELLAAYELKKLKEKAESKVRQHSERAERRESAAAALDDAAEEEEERKKRVAGAAIAPPTNLIQQDAQKLAAPDPHIALPTAQGPKGMDFAARMMSKMGYKAGTGLGRQKQGMTTALSVEKTSERGGRIIHEKDRPAPKEEPPEFTDVPEPVASALPVGALPPPPEPTPITELLKNPTKILMLKNMVPPSEAGDPELEAEVREEMTKYGDVVRVMVYAMPPPTEEYDAVRIFVEFGKIDQAIKAVVDLNGRFFGGREVRAYFYDIEKFNRFDLTA